MICHSPHIIGFSLENVTAKIVVGFVECGFVPGDWNGPISLARKVADKLAEVFGLTEAEADSLTKANKTALVKILNAFENKAE